eukprot:6204486-Pleurochrysis_carterae.AAC.4
METLAKLDLALAVAVVVVIMAVKTVAILVVCAGYNGQGSCRGGSGDDVACLTAVGRVFKSEAYSARDADASSPRRVQTRQDQ